GFLKTEEVKKLHKALGQIHNSVKKGTFRYDAKAEDIHTDIQNALENKIGNLVLKLHTARSRNDQIAFDVKFFCKIECGKIAGLCKKMQQSLLKVSAKNKEIIMPGYTHLQHAQLICLGDYLGSYAEMLKRDSARLKDASARINLVMGSGALAGTPIPAKLYNETVKKFTKEQMEIMVVTPPVNSLDSVSDRDFVIEILSSLAILGMHLSRLAEDLILWSSGEFGFMELDDAFATGSSLMPQKKNPDVLELIRGYSGMLYGNLLSVLTMMKGLPLAYNRDMQLDKQPLFSSVDIVSSELAVLPGLVETIKWNKDAIKSKVDSDETLYATDLIYYLMKKGMPFREAHETIGQLVKYSINSGKKIHAMTDADLKKVSAKLKHKEIAPLMNPKVSVESRISIDRTKPPVQNDERQNMKCGCR
ncbi:MAG: argininosuccinate lyase, partial [Candidatus Omnitrophota bacterium]|nr:argininosuccinate lyase [Candidatus Omnitrophota bacterium]